MSYNLVLPEITHEQLDCWVRPQILCADGTTISVQASAGHYCTPRDGVGPYTTVEVGYPSAPWPEAVEYKEGDDSVADSDAVFGYVPVVLVEAYIAAHGGAVGIVPQEC
jgi:hypothetical protein